MKEKIGRQAGIGQFCVEESPGTGAAHLLADLPHWCLVNLAHGEAVKARAGVDDRLDLVATGNILVDLIADVEGGLEGGGVGLLEDLLVLVVEALVNLRV